MKHEDYANLEELVRELWGRPDHSTNTLMWDNPTRIYLGSQVNVKMVGSQHEVDPESWIMCTKYSVSLYLKSIEYGIPATLRKLSYPCESRDIGKPDGTLDLNLLCVEAVQSLRESRYTV